MNPNALFDKAPIAAFSRLRFQIDGQGITTLVCFQGCPLRCKLCINPHMMNEKSDKATYMTPQTLYEKVKIDELYFLASGGGVTFGGGEPLLYPKFIKEFRNICGDAWHLCVETSLAVPWENVEQVADAIDMFYVDCKDIDPVIYKKYTGQENTRMLENIKALTKRIPPENIVVRIPFIPGYNTEEHQQKSNEFFSKIGLLQTDLFTYLENFGN